MHPGFESWPLASGLWRRDPAVERWTLQRAANGQPAGAGLSAADTAWFVAASTDSADPAQWFPPEFRHSPASGAALAVAAAAPSAAWITPHGHGDARAEALQARGLRRTRQRLSVAPHWRETDRAPAELPLPPRGAYEFVVARAGAARDVLLALEPDQATLWAWLPRSARWLPLERSAGAPLAESALPRERWGAELLQDGAGTQLLLPTAAGLALLQPDLLAGTYTATPVGGAGLIGAPRHWSGLVWAPRRSGEGRVEIVGVDPAGNPVHRLGLALTAPPAACATPVAVTRSVVWPSERGQLVLRKDSDGAPEAVHLDWPIGISPRFEFGSPYLSRTGVVWQLCFDAGTETYVYLQLGRAQPEQHAASSPRLCTGTQCYKLSQRLEADPWIDPELAFDAHSHEVVVPLVESEHDDAVLGLVMQADSGIAELMAGRERCSAVLQLQRDRAADLRFHTLIASQPWRARVFVHDAHLWLYHPDLEHVAGWPLEAAA